MERTAIAFEGEVKKKRKKNIKWKFIKHMHIIRVFYVIDIRHA